jgi:hypothetical protein
MQISLGKPNDKVNFRATEVPSFEKLAELICKLPYSLGTFRNDYRNKENFIQTQAIGLDFDDGMTLTEAEENFKDFIHIIAPTRSHRTEKNGKVADRFRVILLLSEPITDSEIFESTWFSLAEKWPNLDRACKDASRYFFPSSHVHSIKADGFLVDVVHPVKTKAEPDEAQFYAPGQRGKLGAETCKLLIEGAENGGRNHAVFKAAKDYQQNLYTLEEAVSEITQALEDNGTIASDFTAAEVEAAIRSAYGKEARHEPRIKARAFQFKPIDQLYDETDGEEIEWLVKDLLQVGGVSLLSADPKAGKSVIARQLCKHVIEGAPFFGRDCRKGAAVYLGLEEHRMMLAKSFRRLGIQPGQPLYVHAEDPLTEDGMFKDFHEMIVEMKPALAIVDTVFDLLEVESENHYREVKKAFKALRRVARESGTHIMAIHHNSKPQKDNRRRGNHAILGSTAISGGVDAILVVELEGSQRLITTSGREVVPWNRRRLEWDQESGTYALGSEFKEENW